jgi:hypothetical protein
MSNKKLKINLKACVVYLKAFLQLTNTAIKLNK